MVRLAWAILLLFAFGCSKPDAATSPATEKISNRRVEIANADANIVDASGPTVEERIAEGKGLANEAQIKRQKTAEEVANQAVIFAEKADVAGLTQKAQQGDVQAMVTLGALYFEGKQVIKNPMQAQRWWSEAARKGDKVAAQNLQLLVKPKADKSTSFLGLEGKGLRFVFIIDKSASMWLGGRFVAAQKELIKTLRSLPEEAVFMIYFFDDGAEAMPARQMLPATKQNIDWACQWVSNRVLGGGTDPSQALTWAFNLKPDTIWLLSDGEFSDDSARVVATGNPKKEVRVHTIAFHDDSGKALMERIARANGGQFRFVPPQ